MFYFAVGLWLLVAGRGGIRVGYAQEAILDGWRRFSRTNSGEHTKVRRVLLSISILSEKRQIVYFSGIGFVYIYIIIYSNLFKVAVFNLF